MRSRARAIAEATGSISVTRPMFAGFCIYAYRKFVRYEDAPPPQPSATETVTEIPAGLLPERPRAAKQSDDSDPVMREYNAYLAELARNDRPDRNTA